MRKLIRKLVLLMILTVILTVCIQGYLHLKLIFLVSSSSTKTDKKQTDLENKETAEEATEATTGESDHTDNPVYPQEKNDSDDRILLQLKFVPASVRRTESEGRRVKLKTIAAAYWPIPTEKGQTEFLRNNCTVPNCRLTFNNLDKADVVLFFNSVNVSLKTQRSPSQIWMLYMLESPYYTPKHDSSKSLINWTATYRHDSTIVAPYEKFVAYRENVSTQPQTRNFAQGKTKKVAWFVSNCKTTNGRLEYAKKMQDFISVDIYGNCGTLHCPRYKADGCFNMLNKDYKFYLSFENSNCRDYITEKFFVNGLKHDVIPIVMGAHPDDYRRAAPPNSFIHVDEFENPKQLAEYLHKLDQDDVLYNQYFQWKGTGDMINTLFWCRVCALAHDVEERGPSWYQDVNKWWRGDNVCIGQQAWREVDLGGRKLIADLAVTSAHHSELDFKN